MVEKPKSSLVNYISMGEVLDKKNIVTDMTSKLSWT